MLSRGERPADLTPAVEWVEGDITDTASLPRHLSVAQPDVVIHAAAVVSDTDPHLHNVNVTGTANLVAALEQLALESGTDPARLVFVSSFSVEDIPPTPYSESKLEAEAVVRASELPFVIMRPTLIYGAGDPNHTPNLVRRMREGTMWLPDGGSALIQPAYVDDVAAALVAAAEGDGLEGRTFRLGGSTPLSVCNFRYAVRDASGGAGRIRSVPLFLWGLVARALALVGKHRPLSVLHFHLADHSVDSSEAIEELGYAPRSLKQGLTATFARR